MMSQSNPPAGKLSSPAAPARSSSGPRQVDFEIEFFQKIRAPFWCFHDRDIAPEGATLRESHRNLDALVAAALEVDPTDCA